MMKSIDGLGLPGNVQGLNLGCTPYAFSQNITLLKLKKEI